MYTTNNYNLSLLVASQAQKEITVNEAFGFIDGILHKAILNSDIKSLPQQSDNSDLYIISNEPEEALANYKQHIALYLNGWRFIKPKNGMIFFDLEKESFVVFKNNLWKKIGA